MGTLGGAGNTRGGKGPEHTRPFGPKGEQSSIPFLQHNAPGFGARRSMLSDEQHHQYPRMQQSDPTNPLQPGGARESAEISQTPAAPIEGPRGSIREVTEQEALDLQGIQSLVQLIETGGEAHAQRVKGGLTGVVIISLGNEAHEQLKAQQPEVQAVAYRILPDNKIALVVSSEAQLTQTPAGTYAIASVSKESQQLLNYVLDTGIQQTVAASSQGTLVQIPLDNQFIYKEAGKQKQVIPLAAEPVSLPQEPQPQRERPRAMEPIPDDVRVLLQNQEKMSLLTPRQREVLEAVYDLESNTVQRRAGVARTLGVTKVAVYVVERNALEQLRAESPPARKAQRAVTLEPIPRETKKQRRKSRLEAIYETASHAETSIRQLLEQGVTIERLPDAIRQETNQSIESLPLQRWIRNNLPDVWAAHVAQKRAQESARIVADASTRQVQRQTEIQPTDPWNVFLRDLQTFFHEGGTWAITMTLPTSASQDVAELIQDVQLHISVRDAGGELLSMTRSLADNDRIMLEIIANGDLQLSSARGILVSDNPEVSEQEQLMEILSTAIGVALQRNAARYGKSETNIPDLQELIEASRVIQSESTKFATREYGEELVLTLTETEQAKLYQTPQYEEGYNPYRTKVQLVKRFDMLVSVEEHARDPLALRKAQNAMFEAYQQTGDQEPILLANDALVFGIISQRLRIAPGTPYFDDLMQEGRIALSRAIAGYDWHREESFITYAYVGIMRAAGRALGEEDSLIHIPGYVRQQFGRAEQLMREAELNPFSPELLALLQEKEVPTPEYLILGLQTRDQKVLSLDQELETVRRQSMKEGERLTLADRITDTRIQDFSQALIQQEAINEAIGTLRHVAESKLPPKEREAAYLYLGLTDGIPKTRTQITQIMRITRSRVEQLLVSADTILQREGVGVFPLINREKKLQGMQRRMQRADAPQLLLALYNETGTLAGVKKRLEEEYDIALNMHRLEVDLAFLLAPSGQSPLLGQKEGGGRPDIVLTSLFGSGDVARKTIHSYLRTGVPVESMVVLIEQATGKKVAEQILLRYIAKRLPADYENLIRERSREHIRPQIIEQLGTDRVLNTIVPRLLHAPLEQKASILQELPSEYQPYLAIASNYEGFGVARVILQEAALISLLQTVYSEESRFSDAVNQTIQERMQTLIRTSTESGKNVPLPDRLLYPLLRAMHMQNEQIAIPSPVLFALQLHADGVLVSSLLDDIGLDRFQRKALHLDRVRIFIRYRIPSRAMAEALGEAPRTVRKYVDELRHIEPELFRGLEEVYPSRESVRQRAKERKIQIPRLVRQGKTAKEVAKLLTMDMTRVLSIIKHLPDGEQLLNDVKENTRTKRKKRDAKRKKAILAGMASNLPRKRIAKNIGIGVYTLNEVMRDFAREDEAFAQQHQSYSRVQKMHSMEKTARTKRVLFRREVLPEENERIKQAVYEGLRADQIASRLGKSRRAIQKRVAALTRDDSSLQEQWVKNEQQRLQEYARHRRGLYKQDYEIVERGVRELKSTAQIAAEIQRSPDRVLDIVNYLTAQDTTGQLAEIDQQRRRIQRRRTISQEIQSEPPREE